MKFEVNVRKKFAFMIFGAILILAGSIYGYAQSPAIFGHSGDEIAVTDAFCRNITGQNCGPLEMEGVMTTYSTNFAPKIYNGGKYYTKINDIPLKVVGSTEKHILAVSVYGVSSGTVNPAITIGLANEVGGLSIATTTIVVGSGYNNGRGTIYSKVGGTGFVEVSPAGHEGDFYITTDGGMDGSVNVQHYIWLT